MAGECTAPNDKPPDKYYKCHLNIRFGAIVCFICEDTYYHSDFKKLKNKKINGEILAICPKHAYLKLTSNFNKDTLSDEAKLILTEIKAIRKEVIQKEILDVIAAENLKVETTLLTHFFPRGHFIVDLFSTERNRKIIKNNY